MEEARNSSNRKRDKFRKISSESTEYPNNCTPVPSQVTPVSVTRSGVVTTRIKNSQEFHEGAAGEMVESMMRSSNSFSNNNNSAEDHLAQHERTDSKFETPLGGRRRNPKLTASGASSATDEVPSLHSTSSSFCSYAPSPTRDYNNRSPRKHKELWETNRPPNHKPINITCKSSEETPSPLYHDKEQQQQHHQEQDQGQDRKLKAPFSPPPGFSMFKTSIKSPTNSNSQFHNLPSLHDAKLSSPCTFLLSPSLPSPGGIILDTSSFDQPPEKMEEDTPPKSPSPAFTTPTDFAVDFGKDNHKPSPTLDGSNVLALLQSPTNPMLFSPGSTFNTPKGSRTPVVEPSFFFSDAAGLLRASDFLSLPPSACQDARPASPEIATPKPPKRSASISGMIWISPLASSKRGLRRRHSSHVPVNFKNVFESPQPVPSSSTQPEPKGNNWRPRVPMLDPKEDLDVHMAERDLMEDEDLSVLLRRASAEENGEHVFRPSAKIGPHLGFPIISHQHKDDTDKKDDKKRSKIEFAPPHLSIRSNVASGSKEIYLSNNQQINYNKSTNSNNSNTSQQQQHHHHNNETRSKRPKEAQPEKVVSRKSNSPPREKGTEKDASAAPTRQHKSKGNKKARVAAAGPAAPGNMRPYPIPPISYHGMPYPMHAGPILHPRAPSPREPNSPHQHSPHRSKSFPSDMAAKEGYMMYHHPYRMPPYQYYPPRPPHVPIYKQQQQQPPPPKNTTRKGKPSKGACSSNATSSGTTAASGMSTTTSTKDTKRPAPEQNSASKKPRQEKTKDSSLAAAILRGVTMRPSGKWQAQLYYAGKSRYIGVFDTREKAALAYEIAREQLKSNKLSPSDLKATEDAVNRARKAAFDGVNEKEET